MQKALRSGTSTFQLYTLCASHRMPFHFEMCTHTASYSLVPLLVFFLLLVSLFLVCGFGSHSTYWSSLCVQNATLNTNIKIDAPLQQFNPSTSNYFQRNIRLDCHVFLWLLLYGSCVFYVEFTFAITWLCISSAQNEHINGSSRWL